MDTAPLAPPILRALHSLDDPRWREAVRAAWTGSVVGTAAALGIGRATLFRWLDGAADLRAALGVRRGAPVTNGKHVGYRNRTRESRQSSRSE